MSDPIDYTDITDEALNAFWAVVARRFPAIKTGDLSPETTIRTQEVMEEAVQEWVEGNSSDV